MSPRGASWHLAVLLVAGIVTYANSLSGAFVLDDQSTIVNNQTLREWWKPSSVLVPEQNTAIAGRPLVNLSLAANYAVGGLDPTGYHVVNIGLHLLCGLLVYSIVRRTMELPAIRGRTGASASLAFAAALLWVVHPLNSEVVDYLTERTESLMALFYLGTLYASIRGWHGRAVMACALGMACKESMATVPLVIALYDRVFLFPSFKAAFRSRKRLYAGLAASWIVLAILMASGPRTVAGFSTGIPVWTWMLNQSQMIVHYLRLAFWPRSLVAFYGWPASLTPGDVWSDVLIIGLLLLATAVALIRAPIAGFLGAWFFATLAPASSIVPISTEVGAERRMYLPLLALILLVVLAANRVGQRIEALNAGATKVRGVVGFAALAGIAVSLSVATMGRNREYASPVTLARTIVERRPTAVAHDYLGEQLALAGLHDEAIIHLRTAVTGGDSRAGFLLGHELFNADRLPEAIEQLEAFINTANLPYRLVPHWLEPPANDVVTARLLLAQAATMQRRWSDAAEQARLVLERSPGNQDAELVLAESLYGQQRYEEAAVHYRKVLESQPDDPHALTNLGITQMVGGHLDEAIASFRHAAAVNPNDPGAHRILAMALLDRGDYGDAAAEARRAVELNPDDGALQDLLVRANAALKAR